MDRTMYFFCDIMGTFDGGSNRGNEIQQLVQNLLLIKDKKKVEHIAFSFITADSSEYLSKAICELEPYIRDTCIYFAEQFSYNEKIIIGKDAIKREKSEGSKIEQMIECIYKNGINTNFILYADDNIWIEQCTLFYQCFQSIPLQLLQPSSTKTDVRRELIRSQNKGITGLNICLSRYLHSSYSCVLDNDILYNSKLF